jgi:hypothetical protein
VVDSTAESIVFELIFWGGIIELYLSSPPSAVRGAAWRRRSLLLALAGAHVLAFLLWPAPERATALQADAGRPITWLTLPAMPAPAPARAQRAAPTVEAKRPQAPPVAIRLPEQMRAPQAITLPPPSAEPAPAPPDPFALTPAKPTADDFKQALRKSAGAVDRQLRKESWNPRDKVIASTQTGLARGMGAAFQGDDGVSQENVITPDGRMMTKVKAGGSTYCAAMQSNGLVGGRDVFKDGVKTEVRTCPQYVK